MSKPQVTITLGRSGQVVKRGGTGTASDDGRRLSGSKRTMREGFVGNAESSLKRQRGNGSERGVAVNGVAGVRVGRNDLRLKLMRKNLSKQARGDVDNSTRMDLRDRLSRTVWSPQSVNLQQRRPEPKESTLTRRIPPVKSADDLLLVDSSRNSRSSWAVDGLRSRSPDRILRMSRGLSPPRNIDEMQRGPSIRSIDASRSRQFLSNDIHEPPRRVGTMPMTLKAAPEPSKPIGQLPTANGIMHKSSFAGEEPLTVTGLLHSLGLGKYAIHFQAEEVDMTALRQMGDNDLREMGIPMGPRKKILLALMPRSKRQPP